MIHRARRSSFCAQTRRGKVDEWVRWVGGIAFVVLSGALAWLKSHTDKSEERLEKKVDAAIAAHNTLAGTVNDMRAGVISRPELQQSIDRVLSAQSENIERLAKVYTDVAASQARETREAVGKLEGSIRESEKEARTSREQVRDRLEEFGRAAAVAAERSGTTEEQLTHVIEETADLTRQVQGVSLRMDAWSVAGGPSRA